MQMWKPLVYWHWKIFLKGLLFCWVGASNHSWKCKCDPFISIQQSRAKMYSNTDLQLVEEEMASFVKLSFPSWRTLICPNLSNPSGSKKAPWQHYIMTLISQCLFHTSNKKNSFTLFWWNSCAFTFPKSDLRRRKNFCPWNTSLWLEIKQQNLNNINWYAWKLNAFGKHTALSPSLRTLLLWNFHKKTFPKNISITSIPLPQYHRNIAKIPGLVKTSMEQQ